MLVAALSGAAPTYSQTPSATRQPDDIQVSDRWPIAALANKSLTEARVILECEADARGMIGACQAASEIPAGLGFGGIAIVLARDIKLRSGDSAGLVRLPFHFTRNSYIPKKLSGHYTSYAWSRTPSRSDVQKAFPSSAKVAVGDATLRCTVTQQGLLSPCRVLKEKPARQGFGEAAKGLAPLFWDDLSPEIAEGWGTITTDVAIHFEKAEVDNRPPPVARWLRRISLDEANALYPAEAKAGGISKGQVRVKCRIAAEGKLSNCETISETPVGYGFGKAGIATAAVMRLDAWDPAGYPMEGRELVIPMNFNGP